MVKHVIIWKLKEEHTAEKDSIRAAAKEHLEALVGQIDGLLYLHVDVHPLASSNGDMILDSGFRDEASLHAYSVHPKHVAVADTYVRPYAEMRMCYDYDA